MKKLNSKAFWVILAGMVGTIAYRVIDLVFSRNREFPALQERVDAARLERLSTALFRLNFITTIIFILIAAYFIYRLVTNTRNAQGQKYLSFLFVANIVVAILHALSMLRGNWMAVVSIAINLAIIIGCTIQKRYEAVESIV